MRARILVTALLVTSFSSVRAGPPPEKPRLVVAVRINEGTPTVIKQGSLDMPVMSFELFRRVATDAMKILGLADGDIQAT